MGKGGRGSTKIKAVRTPEQQVTRLAKRILPEGVAHKGEFVLQDVQNQTDADQRHMMRSDEKKTVRRLTRVEKMCRAGMIDKDELAACEWYADAYSLGYDTLGVVADYGRSGGGGGDAVVTHLAKYRAQQEARDDYAFGREGIPAPLLKLFERVVLLGEAIGEKGKAQRREALRFRFAASCLRERILHLLPIR